MIENLRLLKNKVRIWILTLFTNRVKRIVIQANDGSEHEVTVERQVEKVCTHKRIEEIATTLWRCMECPDVYFQISAKLIITERELVNYLSTIADHFKLKITDKENADA